MEINKHETLDKISKTIDNRSLLPLILISLGLICIALFILVLFSNGTKMKGGKSKKTVILVSLLVIGIFLITLAYLFMTKKIDIYTIKANISRILSDKEKLKVEIEEKV
ncbi:hypothetical protein NEFER03_0544 [Nematocida sp. LUAm3]|nr:hypothetical protein NEFER03_0544 [Nematocida sp. LUAm3]KAI5175511.1 hypothetical protein NEFER02_1417 [Nematocida sp. LUAm2]KAI5178459.1 hypothetical protein NEFER01_1606 [Nematocida sp. LUAm1]